MGDTDDATSSAAKGKASKRPMAVASSGGPGNGGPCGACRFLRRKCNSGCIFAPYFGTEQGAARFAAVHKVFGASNVTKLLLHIPVSRRHDALVTISYEAQARLSDPVYGCVSTILALQHQVACLEAELGVVQSQVMNSRLAYASSHQHLVNEAAAPLFSNNIIINSSPNNIQNNNNVIMNMMMMNNSNGFVGPSSGFDDDHQDISRINHVFHHP